MTVSDCAETRHLTVYGGSAQSPEPNRRRIARAYTNGIVSRLSTIQNDQEQLFSGWGDCTNDLNLYRRDSTNHPKSANFAGILNTRFTLLMQLVKIPKYRRNYLSST
jgi:hypothetical protein